MEPVASSRKNPVNRFDDLMICEEHAIFIHACACYFLVSLSSKSKTTDIISFTENSRAAARKSC